MHKVITAKLPALGMLLALWAVLAVACGGRPTEVPLPTANGATVTGFIGVRTFAALTALWQAARTDTSSSFGRFYRGRTLNLAVMEIERAPEIRYATIDPQDVIRHYRLLPSEAGLELVLVRLKVQNHSATSAKFTMDKEGAMLNDFFRGSYQPVDVSNRTLQDMRGQSSVTVHVCGGQCFDPKRLNILPDTAVTWINDDQVRPTRTP